MAKITPYNFFWGIADSLPVFKTERNIPLIEVPIRQRLELLNVGSEAFSNYCVHTVEQNGMIIKSEEVSHIVKRLKAKIWALPTVTEINTRVAQGNDCFYYDLGNEDGEIVKTTAKGYKIIHQSQCAKKFIKESNMKPQVRPIHSDKISIFDLRKHLKVKNDEDFHLLLIHIITCFITNIAHTIPLITGSYGGTKTTSCVMIKNIVDPAYADILSLPKSKRDLIVTLSRGYMFFFDNIKSIDPEFNDIFCQTSTGGYQIARKLFTDEELVAYKLKRCLILNGMANLTDQPDLIDRSIGIGFERIPDSSRKTEDEVYKSFYEELPYFLDCIFNILSQAIKVHKDIHIKELPRMASFAKNGYSIAEVLGLGGEYFLEIYRNNQKNIVFELIQDNPTATALLDFMKNKSVWEGSVHQLWVELDRFAKRKGIRACSHYRNMTNYVKMTIWR